MKGLIYLYIIGLISFILACIEILFFTDGVQGFSAFALGWGISIMCLGLIRESG